MDPLLGGVLGRERALRLDRSSDPPDRIRRLDHTADFGPEGIRRNGADRDGKLPLVRDHLEKEGVLAKHAKNPDLYVFVKNHSFNSPTAAGDIINGANLSGRSPWFHKTTKQSLKEWLLP